MPRFEFKGKMYNNPAELTEAVLGGKWKMPVLWRLGQRSWRFNELHRDLGKVSPKVLTQQLRELEADGLLIRKIYAVIPPHVDYSLTPLGETALPVIEAFRSWGKGYRKAWEADQASLT